MSCESSKCIFVLAMCLKWERHWSESLLFDKHFRCPCPNTCFCPGLAGNILGSVGSMAAWWNEGKYVVVNDRTPQSLMNSSLSDLGGPTQSTHRACFIDTCTRCTTHISCSKGGRSCWNKCSQEKKLHHCWYTQTWQWLMLSMCRRYIPYSNTVNCIWCKCFPNQARCLEQTCFLD